MNKKVAFLVPTWKGHRDYYTRFVNSFKRMHADATSDLYCVIGSSENPLDYRGMGETLMIPERFFGTTREEGIINIKKLWGAYSVSDKYEYIIIVDDDTIIDREVDYLELCREWYSRHILLGNSAYDKEIVPIVKSTCRDFFDDYDKQKISVKEGDLYLWFNQPSIYKCETLSTFLSYIGVLNHYEKLSFFSFDYYLYMYWLLCKENFSILNLEAKSEFGIYETLGKDQLIKYNKSLLEKYEFQMTDYMTTLIGINPVFRIHVDRKYKPVNTLEKVKIKVKGLRKLIKLGLDKK